jgi:hypothetical protein
MGSGAIRRSHTRRNERGLKPAAGNEEERFKLAANAAKKDQRATAG